MFELVSQSLRVKCGWVIAVGKLRLAWWQSVIVSCAPWWWFVYKKKNKCGRWTTFDVLIKLRNDSWGSEWPDGWWLETDKGRWGFEVTIRRKSLISMTSENVYLICLSRMLKRTAFYCCFCFEMFFPCCGRDYIATLIGLWKVPSKWGCN